MTELLPSAVVEMDDTLGITYVNQSGLALFGYTGQDIEDGLNAIDLLHPEDRKRAAQRIAGYLEGTYVPPTEYRVLKKDGTEMPVLLKAAPIRQAGEITGFRASIADVSKLKEAQTELAEALDAARRLQYEAESANRAKSAFLANMSHELRTPLNAILGYAQLMARDADVSPAQQEYLETIARSGEHLLGLINDVLTTSKIEAGRVTLQEQAFDLHRQLYGLQAMFQMRAGDKGLALHLEIAPQVPRYVLADEGKLRQVLMNLLSNAVKFTQEGGVVLRVGVGGQESGAMEEFSSLTNPQSQTQTQASSPQSPIPILFEVEDTGVGIAPQEMDTLFDPFVQTASGQRASEGTGLGLSISQQFVNLMDGELSVESTVGRGTVFRVQLPVAWADAGMVETLDALPQRRVTGVAPGQTAPDGGAFRLLIVEDDAANRDLLLGLLSPFGFEMRVAVDGAEGVETWEEWQPHLVWMDMRLPVLDGYAATRRIKARAKATGRSALVVALTASAFEQDRAAIFDAGCDDFVRKPYRDHEILDVLHRHLGVRFIYEPDTPATRGSDDAAAGVSQQELRTAVADLSAKWVDDLYHAAVALDADQMHTLIEAIRPQAPHLADRLAQWVHDFEYDRVIALIRPAA
jgi:PAS domain S-box-containing protein